jgi:diguanylate cyclase (GGDEF)-like protein/PAS domain S-box-containing protein
MTLSGNLRALKTLPLGFLLLPGDGLLLVSETSTVTWVDRWAEQILGIEGAAWVNQPLQQCWPTLAEELEMLDGALDAGPLHGQILTPSGTASLQLRLFRTDSGVGIGLVLHQAGSEADQPLVQLLSSVINTVQDALLITLAEPMDSPGPIIVFANSTLVQQTGYGLNELLGRSPRLFQGVDTDLSTTRRFGVELRRWRQPRMEVLNYSRSGRPYWVELKVAPLADAEGWYTHWVSAQRDVSERKAGEQQLVQQVLSDPLTGLLNRRGLLDQLERALSHDSNNLALIFCDLDRFKEVNDRYGHAVGDALLLELTNRLQGVLRGQDTLARLGGDEFVVLIEQLQSDEDALALAERLRTCLAEPWQHDGKELSLSMSMGVALGHGPGPIDAEELLRRADLTMYQVKAAGRDGVATYTLAMDAEVQEGVSLRQQLEQGLRHERLLLHYQPLVNLETGQVLGVEALVRLRSSRNTLISPEDFIPVAERTGLILPLERWVLGEAMDTLAAWQRGGLPWGLAINVSPQHLERGHLADELLREQERSGADLAGLTVEITETVLLQAHARAHSNLTRLKSAGVSIALDDFGTGYSSLAWLSQLPIDKVKLDQSYVRQVNDDPRCSTLLQGFVTVFQDLGLQVLAEGIETMAQRQTMLAMGCKFGQGYLFGRPMPLNDPLWNALPLS